MNSEENQELAEIVDSLITELIYIEKNNFSVSDTQYSKIFRGLHNIKSTLAMVGEDSFLVEFVHENENLWMNYKNSPTISKGSFNTLYHSLNQLAHYLATGIKPQVFNKIHQCGNCKADPGNCMPEGCKEKITDYIKSPISLIEHCATAPRFEVKSKVLLVANTVGNCKLTTHLKSQGIHFDKLDCLREVQNIGKNIIKYELIIIDVDQSTMPFFLSLRILNTINRKAQIIACGEQKDTSYAFDFSDVCYLWVGKKSPNFSNYLNCILKNVQPKDKIQVY